MKSGKILFTSLLLLTISVTDAWAAQKGLFLLGAMGQSVGLSYQFGRQDVSSNGRHSSSMQNRFQENYNFDINYAVYNERILKGKIAAKARANQEFFYSSRSGSSDSSSNGLLYNVYGVFLERGYMPVKFFAGSELTFVQNSFSPGYNLATDSYGFGTAVRNKMFPLSIDYSRYTSETTGLPEDRIQTSDQVSLLAVHSVPSISETELGLYGTKTRSELKADPAGDTDSRRSYRISLRNALSTRDGKYALQSSLQARDDFHNAKTGNLGWQEAFTWRLGKGLSLGLGYGSDYNSQESPIDNTTTTRTSNAGSLWLSHQLFQNLISRLDLAARRTDVADGSEREYTGRLGFAYTRTLPRDGRLTLSYDELRTVTDRSIASGEIEVIDEPMTAQTSIGARNVLQQPNVIPTSIVVKDAEVLGLIYSAGPDYEVLPSTGPVTELNFAILGSLITEGRPLLVSYRFRVNPSIEYGTTGRTLGASVSLSGGHRLTASYGHSSQELISGRAELLQLNDSNSYKVGYAWESEDILFGLDESYLDSTLDRHNVVEGYIRSTKRFPVGRLMWLMRDRYAIFWATQSNPRERRENVFTATANYSRPLFTNGNAAFSASFSDSRGGSVARDDAQLGVDFDWGYGKLFVKVAGRLDWRSLSGATALENQVSLEVKRYF